MDGGNGKDLSSELSLLAKSRFLPCVFFNNSFKILAVFSNLEIVKAKWKCW